MKKKALAGGIIAVALVVLTSCAGQDNPRSKGEETTASGVSSKEERLKLTFLTWDGAKMTDQPYAVKAMQDKFNVDITFQPEKGETYQQQLLLDIASGKMPDYWVDLKMPEYDKFVAQGIPAELSEDFIKQNAPNYYNWLVKNSDQEDPFIYQRRDGKIYSLPIIWTLGSDGTVVGIRNDWLKNVGITKVPETLGELEEALIKFRNDDPDKNGKKDTYGMVAKAELQPGVVPFSDMFTSIFAAFGVYPGAFTEENGVIVKGEIQPGAKDALTVLNKWYKQDLIDLEFAINKKTNIEDKIISEKFGVVESNWWNFLPARAFSGGKYYEKIPGVDWALFAGPKGPNGDYGAIQRNPVGNSGQQFAKRLEKDQEKLKKYLEVMDAYNFNKDVRASVIYGEDGTTYNITSEGDYQFIPPYDEESERIKFGIGPQYPFMGSFNDYEFQTPFMTDAKYRDLRKKVEHIGKGKYDILEPVSRPLYNEYKDRLDQFAVKAFIDFITGKRPISEFYGFVTEWKAMGGDQVMKEAKQKYDELFKK
ncbi:extracellular solute-binding protein [Bacillus sp. FJAT-28004]|uniref:extracellular solute-binding protein n=1 Tax=Bacillus sp. FJAT-28004 TaxID=1679165 RepID=UPI000ABD1DC0|nr:extracellular solute-binding protein [Bacillus sp. FJAT-28004]